MLKVRFVVRSGGFFQRESYSNNKTSNIKQKLNTCGKKQNMKQNVWNVHQN